MRYFLLSKVLHIERFFDSLQEACDYINARTGGEYVHYDSLQNHLKEHNNFFYSGWGIDFAIYQRPQEGVTSQPGSLINPDLQNKG